MMIAVRWAAARWRVKASATTPWRFGSTAAGEPTDAASVSVVTDDKVTDDNSTNKKTDTVVWVFLKFVDSRLTSV